MNISKKPKDSHCNKRRLSFLEKPNSCCARCLDVSGPFGKGPGPSSCAVLSSSRLPARVANVQFAQERCIPLRFCDPAILFRMTKPLPPFSSALPLRSSSLLPSSARAFNQLAYERLSASDKDVVDGDVNCEERENHG